MNLYHRISEVKNNIKNLQAVAKMHAINNNKRKHLIVCETIQDNEKHLADLENDLRKHNRIILYRMHHEQHN